MDFVPKFKAWYDVKYKLMEHRRVPVIIYKKRNTIYLIMVDHTCECNNCDCKIKFDCKESDCFCCGTSICYLDWFKE